MKNLKGIAKTIVVGAGVVLASMWALPAGAATVDTHTVTFNNQTTLELDIPQNTYDFGNVNPSTGTYTSASNAVVATVKSNANWSVSVKAGAANFVGVGNSSNTIPVSRLLWGLNAATPTNALTTSDVVVSTGSATASTALNMGYKMSINWTDPVDAYTATLTYTAVNP